MIDLRYNIMKNYKESWNHHQAGFDCWCKPPRSSEQQNFIFHRNYEWTDDGTRYGSWRRLHESGEVSSDGK